MSDRARPTCWFGIVAVMLLPAHETLAGMPSPLVWEHFLNTVTENRLRTFSFFVVAFLVVTLAFQLLWNYIRRDFPRMPRLSYGRAMAVVVVWGALFVLVLTMISGARELMTPGAWERNGATYRLRQE